MQKFHYRAGIAEAKFMGHIIIPAVMNELKQKTTGLEMNMTLSSGTTAEISYLDKEKREWRYPVDLEARTCSCRQWQITGLPCIHALFFITSLPGPAGNIQQYVHDYYSVARFKATYAYALPAMEGKQQLDMVDPGFKLCAPVLKRAAGRPRKSRIRPRSEGAGLGARKRKCTRCGGSGHFGKYCDNTVDPSSERVSMKASMKMLVSNRLPQRMMKMMVNSRLHQMRILMRFQMMMVNSRMILTMIQNILQIMIQVRPQMVIQVRLQMVIMVIQVRLQMMIQVRLQMVTNLLLL